MEKKQGEQLSSALSGWCGGACAPGERTMIALVITLALGHDEKLKRAAEAAD
jgi:hypothetical protein